MVPFVAGRGHSFKGAGMYYLHDKGALTSDRVAWSHTHNLATDDPEKALRWMAFTSKNADRLKEQAGVARTGRKSSAGHVYAFSLAWHPEENPQKDHMLGAAFETLELLGLKEHEAVIVAHQETDHPHIHVICNLVSPKDGRTAVPSYDRLTLSKWAQEHEEKTGKIYCEKRVENNEKRREKATADRQMALVKGREEKHSAADQVQDIYRRCDSGKAFQAALQEAGFTLARGDRRGFVLVDDQGKVHSLSRQLQGQRAADIKARLSDLDEKALPDVKTASEERQYFDRDRYEVEFQKRIVDSAIEAADRKQVKTPEQQGIPADRMDITLVQENRDHLAELDKRRAWEQDMQRKRYHLETQLSEFYGRDKLAKRLEELRREAEKSSGVWGRMTGRAQELEAEIDGLVKNLASIDSRMAEQRGKLETEIKQSQMKLFPSKEQEAAKELEQKARLDAFIRIVGKDAGDSHGHANNPEKTGNDLDI